jgi:hypothetical protein
MPAHPHRPAQTKSPQIAPNNTAAGTLGGPPSSTPNGDRPPGQTAAGRWFRDPADPPSGVLPGYAGSGTSTIPGRDLTRPLGRIARPTLVIGRTRDHLVLLAPSMSSKRVR